MVSGEEVCDDGNAVGGDGCSATCLSIELCGNGVVDLGAAEECDDGNHASHDGCSSGCRAETLRWTAQDSGPVESVFAAMTWDPDRGRVVLTGGERSLGVDMVERSSASWFLSNRTWLRGPDLPSPITRHAMASDNRGAIILFGGESMDAECGGNSPVSTCRPCLLLGDTAWAACPSTLGEGRLEHVMATAPGGGVLVLGGVPLGQSPWLWRDNTWTVAPPIPTAQGGLSSAAVYDAAAGRTYVFGGIQPNNATVAFDGSSWSSSGASLTRIAVAAVYDSARRRVIAFGGQPSAGGGSTPANVLELGADGEWRDAGAASGPRGRFGHVMAYDPITHGALMFGGRLAGDVVSAETWLLRWESATPDERCDGTDADGDGAVGCADEDCWARCTPRCAPGATCGADLPRCGDGVCNPYLEDEALCPGDC